MEAWIEGLMQRFEGFGFEMYVIIALLIAVENIFPPIPSEVILTLGGFFTVNNANLSILGMAVAATIGAVVGALVLYGVGRIFSRERIEGWLDGRLGQVLRLKREDVGRAQAWFDKRGKVTVFLCRFVPVIRSLISIPAGMARMSLPVFLVLTTVGTFLWNLVLVWLGSVFGESWHVVVNYVGAASTVVMVLLGLALVALVIWWFVRRRRQP